jgi:hypothetical protein
MSDDVVEKNSKTHQNNWMFFCQKDEYLGITTDTTGYDSTIAAYSTLLVKGTDHSLHLGSILLFGIN